jgi:mono/diheme cytochrome c family protein
MKSALLAFVCLFVAARVHLSAAVNAGPLANQPVKLEQGLTLTFTVGEKSDTRDARLIALYVPAGTPVTPFLPAGAFTARWEGEINSPLRTEYTIAATVRGTLTLSINAQQILEGAGDTTTQTMNKTLQLNKGGNKIVAELSSDGTEDAMVQVTWSSREFPPEPVPPNAFTHDVAAKDLRGGRRVRDGRLLFAQLRCAACHADPVLVPPKGEGFPELGQDAPLVGELGAKFNETWLAHWIGNPHDVRPRSLMPRVFSLSADGKIDQRARDLAAYFVAQGKRDETAPAAENAPLGGALFATLGCIACHTPPDFQGQDEFRRVPLSHVKAKWQPPALREYLKDPAKGYASSRMPHFRLTEEEAERLTAYLLSGTQREFPPGPAGDAAKGAQLLVSAGCLHCHAGLPPTTQPALTTTLAGGWTKGCLADDPKGRGGAPDFALNTEQREALRAFAASGFHSLKQDTPIEFAERQIQNLRCAACHPRDQQLSTWAQLENELAPLTAAAPATATESQPLSATWAPMLTWAGEKLRPDWLEQFVAGKIAYKPRPYLLARMPGYSSGLTKGLAEGLSFEHGFPLAPARERAPGAEKLEIGLRLVGENGGFNCTTCHALGDRPATAVFEAPGPNFSYTHERLRKAYFIRWTLAPLRIDPETKMPKFADDDGKTPLSDVLEGNAAAQFEAIWHYLGTIPKPTKTN